MKIEEDYWYISYDNGASWTKLGKATGENGLNGADGEPGDAYFSDVTIEEDYVVFVLADGGQTLKLPFYKGFSLSMDFADPTVNYVVVGEEDLVLKYDVANADGDLVTMVFSDLTTVVDESDKTITVKSPSSFAGLDDVEAVTLLVSDGSSTAMASVNVKVMDINPVTNMVKAQTAEDLLRWAYLVNDGNYYLDLTLENDITMPLFEVEADPEGRTYRITDKPITVDSDGVPSGSNWVALCKGISSLSQSYSGHIDGQYKAIKCLRIIHNNDQVGFVGSMYDDASVKNIVFEDAIIKGNNEVGVVGRSQNGGIVENVSVKASRIIGAGRVGGVVGFNYRRVKTGVNEVMSYVRNCVTDNQTVISGADETGGVCGRNDGAVVIGCTNNADVNGKSSVGGVVGYTCSYNNGGINGYVLASGSTSEATITGTQYAGGIVGYSYLNPDHESHGSKSYVTACYSTSAVTATNGAGSFAATTHSSGHYGQIVASWAYYKAGMDYSGNKKIAFADLISSDHYLSAEDITQDIVSDMNQAIDDYNATNGVEQTCPYKWTWTEGSWPTLVEEQVSSN